MVSSSEGSAVSCPIWLRRELVHGDAQIRLGTGLGKRAAEERGRGAVVIGGCRSSTVCLGMTEVADDVHAIDEWFERLKDFGELEACASVAGVHLSIVAPCGT